MSTMEHPPETAQSEAALRLQTEMAAVRLSFTWFGVRRALSAEQKAEAAETFGAAGLFLSAGKKLLDTRHDKFRAVTAVRSRTVAYWRSISLPFPEPGIRLIRRDRIETFEQQLEQFKSDLAVAATELEAHFSDLYAAAREQLGRLFDPADYPTSLNGMFGLGWEYPSVEPPDFLAQLKPELYRQQCARMQARFSEALDLAEQAFIEELGRLVGHLTERLQGDSDGKPKVFRDSAVGNLEEFFTRFSALNVRSNAELDRLVADCRRVVAGVQPHALRDDARLRSRIAQELTTVTTALDTLLVERPRRRILRTPK
jgi:hypothetical protein